MNSEEMILKAKAISYFQQSGIPKSLENCLNDLFKINPVDPYGYLSSYFEKLSSSPTVSRIEAAKCTGHGGCLAIGVTVFGVFKNEEIVLSQVCVPNNIILTSGVPLTPAFVTLHNSMISECVTLINDHVSPLLVGTNPKEGSAIHEILRRDGELTVVQYEEKLSQEDHGDGEPKKEEAVKNKTESAKKSTMKKVATTVAIVPDDPPQLVCPLLQAHSAVSMAMALAASQIVKKTLCEYTAEKLVRTSEGGVALPMVTLLRNGKGFSGKCQLVKRCLLVPKGAYDSAENISSDIRLVCTTLWATVQLKTPLTVVTDYGELVPSFDRAEQFLDLLQDVLKECCLEDKMCVVLEISARSIFDMEKGKYEVAVGQMKSGDEVVAMMVDLIDRYPIVVGLVDPLRKQDKEAWQSLAVAVGDRCWVLSRGGQGRSLTSSGDQPPVSVLCSSVDGHSLYGDYISYVERTETEAVMRCLWLEDLSSEEWLVDLACGLQPTLLALPSPRCSSGAAKLDRWARLTTVSPTALTTALSFPEIFNNKEESAVGDTETVQISKSLFD